MRSTSQLLLTLAAVACLSGCDILDKIPLTPKEAMDAAGRFSLATRELVEETPKGDVYRLKVESRHPAAWYQADQAMWADLRHSCPEGEHHEFISQEPDSRPDALQPAGTVFVRTVRCISRPFYSFEFDGLVDHNQAQSQLYGKLAKSGLSDTSDIRVIPIHGSGFGPRFQQVEDAVGSAVFSQLADCPSGVTLRGASLGNVPRPEGDADADADADGEIAYLGLIVECAGSPLLKPQAVPDSGS